MKNQITRIIEPFGEFEFQFSEKEWVCFTENIIASIVELSIEAESPDQDINDEILIVKSFVNNIDSFLEGIYKFVRENYLKKGTDKNIEELKEMYFLAAITLQKDRDIWVVLEPSFWVESIYSHFLRFTLANEKIIWSSFTGDVEAGEN